MIQGEAKMVINNIFTKLITYISLFFLILIQSMPIATTDTTLDTNTISNFFI